jgi:hypothetical protein
MRFSRHTVTSPKAGLFAVRPEHFDIVGLVRSTQEYSVHSPGGYYPQRTWGVFSPGLPRRFAPAITIYPMGTRWDSVKTRHVEACSLSTLSRPKSERLAMVVSHVVGIQAVIRARRHDCPGACSRHGYVATTRESQRTYILLRGAPDVTLGYVAPRTVRNPYLGFMRGVNMLLRVLLGVFGCRERIFGLFDYGRAAFHSPAHRLISC